MLGLRCLLNIQEVSTRQIDTQFWSEVQAGDINLGAMSGTE